MKDTNTNTNTNRAAIRAVLVRPGEAAEITEIAEGLASYQKIVDGYIECVYPFDDDVCVICNEEGKINGLPLNRALYDESGEIYDVIAGAFVVIGLTDDGFCGLSADLAEKYRALFESPEIFVSVNGRIRVFPVNG